MTGKLTGRTLQMLLHCFETVRDVEFSRLSDVECNILEDPRQDSLVVS